jgi:hypothetical protein
VCDLDVLLDGQRTIRQFRIVDPNADDIRRHREQFGVDLQLRSLFDRFENRQQVAHPQSIVR